MATRLPFRWADFAVAAGIFIAGTLTLLPAIHRSRERMNQAGCVFNLQQLGNSLAQYASLHPFLPYPPSHRSDTHAGMFAVMLHDAGVLDNLSVLDCPCNGPCPHVDERARELRAGRSDPARPIPSLSSGCSAGIMPTTSATVMRRRVMPVRSRSLTRREIPVLADQPDHDDFLDDPRRQQPQSRPPRSERALRRRQRPLVPLARRSARTTPTSISTTIISRARASMYRTRS